MNSTSAAIPLEIDIVSDVVCPWCIIGYRQLQTALARLPGQFAPVLRWHPFELNPGMAPEGEDLREHVARKYGTTRAQSDAARERLVAVGEALGFRFDWFDGMRVVNTFRAHQLLAWAATRSRQTELKLALFDAYFSRREDVSRPEVLARVAARAGLDAHEAAAVLADGRYADAVRGEERLWLDRDIHAVPAFIFDQRFFVPGAQDAGVFVQVLQKLRTQALAEVANEPASPPCSAHEVDPA
jgi:predicted DsbA family dithiol-disulfide isomerase